MARKSSYKPEYALQAAKLTKLGAIDIELADFFEVSEKTINNWKKNFPEFLQSLKQGKDEADTRVKQALYHRAIGYSHPEDKIFNNGTDEGLVVPTIKHYPPDATSCIFWLKNRDPENWRENKDDSGGHADLIALFDKMADKLPG